MPWCWRASGRRPFQRGVEGQHRWKAKSLHPAIDRVLCRRRQPLRREVRAASFVINRDRMAGDVIDNTFGPVDRRHDKCRRHLRFSSRPAAMWSRRKGHYRPNLTNSISAIDRCLSYTGSATWRALLVICAAWPDDAKCCAASLITALARIIRAANEKTVSIPTCRRAIRP